jgi:hypothetical protein
MAKKQIIRRPDSNLPPTPEHINAITNTILGVIGELDDYTANLRALDRQRHNSVGLKRLGFIEAAFRLSTKFPQYFPHWLTTEKFQRDLDLFNAIRSLVEVSRSLEEKAWNINVESSDMIYTDGLENYSQVQDACQKAKGFLARSLRSVPSLREQTPHIYSWSADEPTEKEVERDIHSLLKGHKDGKVVIENISPKTTGGTRKVIDETFKSNATFKETDEGKLK